MRALSRRKPSREEDLACLHEWVATATDNPGAFGLQGYPRTADQRRVARIIATYGLPDDLMVKRASPPPAQTEGDINAVWLQPPPPLVSVNYVGFAVLRPDQTMQPFATNEPERAGFAVELYSDFDDALHAGQEQLIRAYACGTYSADARHIVPVQIRDWPARDYRNFPMSSSDQEEAARTLMHGMAEPWSWLAKQSEGGILLPCSPGIVAFMFERHKSSLTLDDPVGTVTLDDALQADREHVQRLADDLLQADREIIQRIADDLLQRRQEYAARVADHLSQRFRERAKHVADHLLQPDRERAERVADDLLQPDAERSERRVADD